MLERVIRARWISVPGRGPPSLASSARTRRVSINVARALAIGKPARRPETGSRPMGPCAASLNDGGLCTAPRSAPGSPD